MKLLFEQSLQVGIFVTFIKLQELHQSLYKSQINSINNKGMLDLMNKTTSRVQKFRSPVVRKFPNTTTGERQNKHTYITFQHLQSTALQTGTVTGWKAMNATNN